jgi:hypothetical protein
MDLEQPVTSPEQLAPGVTFERVGNVYVFTLGDLSRASIDAWADKLQQLLDTHPEDQVFLTLHHFANPYAVLTPYLKARSEQLRNVRTFSHAAIVLPRTGLTQMVAVLLPKISHGNSSRFFTSREEGLAWLQEQSSGK